MKTAARQFRILMLDQLGTGLSTPADAATLVSLPTPQAQADNLSHFRADSIVADDELIRWRLGSPPWTVLGQSNGGFCTLTYEDPSPPLPARGCLQVDWGRLDDTDVLAKNTVHAAAAVYRHDIHVDRELSLATAAAVRNLEVWETDEYHHDGIADDGEVIFQRLLSMTRRLCPVQEVGWNDKEPRTMCRVPRVHDW